MNEGANNLVQTVDKHLRQIHVIENFTTAESLVAESIRKLGLCLIWILVRLVHSSESLRQYFIGGERIQRTVEQHRSTIQCNLPL